MRGSGYHDSCAPCIEVTGGPSDLTRRGLLVHTFSVPAASDEIKADSLQLVGLLDRAHHLERSGRPRNRLGFPLDRRRASAPASRRGHGGIRSSRRHRHGEARPSESARRSGRRASTPEQRDMGQSRTYIELWLCRRLRSWRFSGHCRLLEPRLSLKGLSIAVDL